MTVLRPYQAELLACAAGADNIVIHAPTGAGKTVVQERLARDEAERGGWTLALSHRRNLQESLAAAMGEHGASLTIQSAVNRLDTIRKPSLILVDETHHAIAPTYRRLLEAFPDARRIGLTATTVPGLSEIYDRMVQGPSTRELIEQGYLCRPRYMGVATPLYLSEVGVRSGEYDPRALVAMLERTRICGDAIEAYTSKAPGRPALIFCVSINHAEATAREWNAAGIRTEVITGKTKDDERNAITARLTAGETLAIASVGVLFEGTDIPAAAVAVILRPTLSTVVHLQSLGRVLRIHLSKADALIIDCASNCLKHGPAEMARTWTLDGLAEEDGRRTTTTPDGELLSIRQCEHCLAIHESGPTHCPSCGTAFGKDRRISVAHKERLEELQAEALERARKMLRRAQRNEEAQAKTLTDFQRIAAARGYKPGWAFARHKLRQDKASQKA